MLSILIWLPLVAAIILFLIPAKIDNARIRLVAFAFSLASLLVSLFAITRYDLQSQGLQLTEFFPWLEILGINYNLGIDGLSLPLIILSNLIICLAIYSGDLGQKDENTFSRPRLFYGLVLILAGCINGALLAQNLLLFFIFYEIKLIPTYLLINIWGGENRGYAGTKYLLYTAFSGIFVLAAFLGIAFLSNSGFDYQGIQTQILPYSKQLVLLITIIIGFAIKTPLVPLHTWLPDAYTESSTPISMILGGILSKLGTYGLIRFGLGLFPQLWNDVAFWLAAIASISALYASFVAISQTDIKKMVAYSSIAHIAFVVLATAAGTSIAISGAICQMFAHGLIVALLFYLVGIVETKTGSRDLNTLKGLMNPQRGLPVIGGQMILAVMASAGIPGMVGFVGEYISFQGSFTVFPTLTILCLVATGLTSVYFVILLNKVFFGKIDCRQTSNVYPKVRLAERIPAFVLTVIIVILGIQPVWLTNITNYSIIASHPMDTTIVATSNK
ncbi:NADH-quinone oxidoreductase subunit M [Waterburya agarophytonicola K14]|uniref:NADH-quinone oxidoreductase subunit M n=1 Tax=Waterburya agarophytonicola KI4 TaxID=2874699 RepID=A0A964BMK3_9CYAN|nr:NADH-quinone oxidoreductase subunit M [Waterburya agarophytonicola]MCC0175447.1 NADH-quinone oxidoreductase subunit M [Waterburya agarophytonicola KI4]